MAGQNLVLSLTCTHMYYDIVHMRDIVCMYVYM